MQTKLSFVIPCYKSEKTIEVVVAEILQTLKQRPAYDYEIILVSDASPDAVYDVIVSMAKQNNKIKGLNFAKNFGQHSAVMAGFRASCGDIIICMDDDGQTPANELFKLVDAVENGADIVFANYDSKKHSRFRNWGSHVNSYMMEKLINKPKKLSANSYFAAKRFVVDEITRYQNPYPYLGGLIFRSTANLAQVDVRHREREQGESGYTIKKLFSLWLNGFTAFSVKPLRISSYIGGLTAFFGMIYSLVIIIRKLVNPNVPLGYSSMMAVLLLLGGLILLILGIIGEYIGRIYICINQAPQYLVDKSINLEPNNANKQ